MDFFDEEQQMKKEDKIKKIFIEQYKKQLKLTKKIVTIIFSCMGILCCLLGAIIYPIEGIEALIPLMILGGIFIAFSILFFFLFSSDRISDKTYDRFIKSKNKYGILNTYTLSVQFAIHEEQIEELETRIDGLERELNDLKRRINFK